MEWASERVDRRRLAIK